MELNNLDIVEIDVESINIDPKNCRKHDKKSIEAIKRSLSEFEQYAPIVIRKENMQIIAGNGTYTACKELGFKKINAVIIDVDEKTATAIGIADNKASDLSRWDFDVLRDIMQQYDRTDFNKIGYMNDKQIDAILSYHKEDEIIEKRKEKITCPRCGKEFKS